MSLGKPEYVSDLVVYLLNRLGVEYVTLNPGATTRGMHESLVTYGGNVAPEVITCSHEEVAVAMAEGYSWRPGGLRPRWFTTSSACSTRARRSTKPGSTTPR